MREMKIETKSEIAEEKSKDDCGKTSEQFIPKVTASKNPKAKQSVCNTILIINYNFK